MSIVTCGDCGGSGKMQQLDSHDCSRDSDCVCPKCSGTGTVEVSDNSGPLYIAGNCSLCGGSGTEFMEDPDEDGMHAKYYSCGRCGGTGKEP